MGHLSSRLYTSLPLKRPSPPVADSAQPSKRRKTFQPGDGDEDAPTVHHQRHSIQRESPTSGYAGQQVFLSHSGHHKSFVEQLFVDLQRENISSFFDKDPDSLPKGENFPTLILEAAEKCRVGVVVLSNEFISSKWPMQELCTLVKAQKSTNPGLKILPLFFGLTPRALSNNLEKRETLKRSWQKLLKSSKQSPNLEEWVSALEALRPINGLVYSQQEGEVAFRAQVVTAIRRLVPPRLPYGESFVQGKERLCQIVAEMFNNTPCKEHGVKIAGLYGVAGIGKTTVARIACNYYSNDFEGRVLHLELGKVRPIERIKCALRILTDASETLVNSVIDLEQGWDLFNMRMMHATKVFLAIDNICDLRESTEEAHKYVGAVRSAGNQSRILLTSRSSSILRRFFPKDEGRCIHVPSLEEEEAIEVLLQLTPLKVSNLGSKEKDITRKCALECYFHWHCTQNERYGVPIRAYHPLALKAFGALLYERCNSCTDLSQWIEVQNLSKPWRSGHMLEEIFGILEESFLRLHKDSREVFMLLSLYMPQPYMTSEAAFNWLALACDTEVEDIKLAIVDLKRKGFVESIWEYGDGLYIHDLHKEFAKNKADGRDKWISVKDSRHIPTSLQAALSSDRPRFSAMKFDNCHFQCQGFVNDELFSNVLVLHLQDMPQLKILNLSPMKIVRSITILGCGCMQEIRGLETLTSLVYFLVKGCSTNLQFSGIEGLLALEHLQVDARHQERTTESSPLSWTSFPTLQGGSLVGDHIETGAERLDLSSCSKLRTIKLLGCDMVEIDLIGCLELTKIEIMDCKNLSEISLFDSNLVGLEITTICSTVTSESLSRHGPAFLYLTEITLVALHNLKELPAFNWLTALRALRLKGMHSLKELPAFSGLTALQILLLEGMRSVKELPDLTGLTALWHLRLEGMHSLKELPALTGLTALRELWLGGMHSLKELPDLTGLTMLQDLWLQKMHSLKELPAFTGLPALQTLWLRGLHRLKGLSAITGLTALRLLQMAGMHSLEELPALTGLTALWLEGTHSLKELPAFTGLTALQGLRLEGMHRLKELPAFTGLTALRGLRLEGMHTLKELPALTGLTALEQLWLNGMHSLKELPALTSLTALQDLRLEGMHSLKEFPTLTALTALRYLKLAGMHSLKELPPLTGLTALEHLWLQGMHSLKELPALTGLTALEGLTLEGMHSLKKLPALTGLTALRYLGLKELHSLKELSAFTGLTELPYLGLEGMHRLKELLALMGLTALERLYRFNDLPALSLFDISWHPLMEEMYELKNLLGGITVLEQLWLQEMHSVD